MTMPSALLSCNFESVDGAAASKEIAVHETIGDDVAGRRCSVLCTLLERRKPSS